MDMSLKIWENRKKAVWKLQCDHPVGQISDSVNSI